AVCLVCSFFHIYIRHNKSTKIQRQRTTDTTILQNWRRFDDGGDENLEQSDDGELIDDDNNFETTIWGRGRRTMGFS
uniref:Uncharacterized protein n=1 Tax=Romanomermis culicivorax TaxID=13658 RepID=A0A915IYI9_ROMCU